MSALLNNEFSCYSLTDQEERMGTILTIDQIQVIQNRLYNVAQLKLNVKIDVTKPLEHVQNLAFYDGRIDAFREIIVSHQIALDNQKEQLSREDKESIIAKHLAKSPYDLFREVQPVEVSKPELDKGI